MLGSCARRTDDGTVVVEVIGGPAALVDAARHTPGEPARVLAGAVAQGLVRFDAAGQIEPGIAERWTVIDNGTDYIFRLRDARWSDGRPVTAADVAAALRAQLSAGAHNPLAPWLSAIDSVVVMTPEVIEVQLRRPRPDLLKLFAQPEMAILARRPIIGTGPFRASADTGHVRLRPAPDPLTDGDDAPSPLPQDQVLLFHHAAARAILRFNAGRDDLVLGGGFADWPLLAVAGAAPSSVRVDPAAGLVGLAIASREGFLADAGNREALSSVFDRQALAAVFGWTPTEQIVPDLLDSATAPIIPGWSALAVPDRRAAARARVAAWQATHPGPIAIRVALPLGPGVNMLWGHLGLALAEAGFVPQRVAADAPAELRLVASVAPYDSARWYLATACRPCGGQALATLDAARQAPSVALRAQALALADQAIAADVPFIPLARPLRWSLVASRLRQWQPNARAWHPLNHLRGATTS
jgi:peptide/nickel transport system substrate-binding protein